MDVFWWRKGVNFPFEISMLGPRGKHVVRVVRSSSSIAMPGGQLRTLEVRCRALPLEEVLEAQARHQWVLKMEGFVWICSAKTRRFFKMTELGFNK